MMDIQEKQAKQRPWIALKALVVNQKDRELVDTMFQALGMPKGIIGFMPLFATEADARAAYGNALVAEARIGKILEAIIKAYQKERANGKQSE